MRTMKIKRITKTLAAIVAVVGIAFMVQSFSAPEPNSVNAPSATASSVTTKKFVKTSNRCTKSNCSCSGYRGYKHDNGTYEGACSNTDGHGHTCGHGPEKHGLRKW